MSPPEAGSLDKYEIMMGRRDIRKFIRFQCILITCLYCNCHFLYAARLISKTLTIKATPIFLQIFFCLDLGVYFTLFINLLFWKQLFFAASIEIDF